MFALGSKKELATTRLGKMPEPAGQYHTNVVNGFSNRRSIITTRFVFSFLVWLNGLTLPYAQSQSTDQPHIASRKPAAVSPSSTAT